MKLRAMMVMVFAMTAAQAQPPDDRYWVQRDQFRSLDRNGDGTLSKNETGRLRDFGPAFDQADENRDGKLTVEEFIQADAVYDRGRVKAYASDAAITAKVKAALIREADVKARDVNVETNEGRVQLSGWVENDAQRKKALQVAKGVDGVREVRDAMSVK